MKLRVDQRVHVLKQVGFGPEVQCRHFHVGASIHGSNLSTVEFDSWIGANKFGWFGLVIVGTPVKFELETQRLIG